MSNRNVMTVNFEIPGGLGEYLPLDSDRSLLDADIIIYEPGIPSNHGYETYNGKTCLTESNSFSAVESIKHWRAELVQAVNSSKTVIVYLVKPIDVFVYTGEKQYSGTGRSRQTTRIVNELNSYSAVPATFDGLIPKGGELIQPVTDLKYLTNYWRLFAQHSKYQIYFEGKFSHVFLKTRTGDKIVGASIRTKSNGTLILLPPPDFDTDKFVKHSEKEGAQWTKEALKVGHQLFESILEIDSLLKSDQELTPPPDWTQASKWRLPRESQIESDIAGVNSQIKQLRDRKTELLSNLAAEGSLRRLLFEKGKPLESAVIESLRLLGFTAQPFRDSESEFDAVFVSEEGRLLGEVEGKDTKPINIDKLSQLERNLGEDFAKEEVTEYAKGVLFGNAQRLLPLKDRGEFFTEKCIKGALRLKVALIRTPDLFPVGRYIRETGDKDFARQCRQAISASEGTTVVFPSPPNQTNTVGSIASSKTSEAKKNGGANGI